MPLQEYVPLAPFTTLKIGGPARWFARAETLADAQEALAFAESHKLPVFVLGGGSNLLVSDEGFNGLILHLALTPSIERTDSGDIAFYEVTAGTDWDQLVQHTVTEGASGIECLAGIPGLTGGTPVQNVGAYGQEVAQTIERVTVLDRMSLKTRTMTAAECGFSYRTSVFNSTARDRFLVLSVRFRLKRDGRPELTYVDLKERFSSQPHPSPENVASAVRAIRRTKGMLIVVGDPDCRSAGSFFKNPLTPPEALARVADALDVAEAEVPHWPAAGGRIKLPAAWLIERAGFHKGQEYGAAGISTRHTLALINRTGTATCADVLALSDAITSRVRDLFGLELEREPVFLGPVSGI